MTNREPWRVSTKNGLDSENLRLKIKLGELVLENDHLKKLHDWAARNQSEDSVVINPTNLDPSHKDAE